jgi:protein SCO1/2
MMRHRRAWKQLLLLPALGLFLLSACGGQPYQFRGTTLEPPSQAADFTLADHNGQSFTLSEQRGNVVLMFFGFTSCPEVCPTTLAEMRAARKELGADAEKVRVVFVTVDPERDTPDRMKRYVTNFDPSFTGLIGTEAELKPIYEAYGVTAIRRELPNSGLKYTMDHTAHTYVIDQQGRLRSLLQYGAPVEDIVSDVRYLVKNGGA